MANRLLHFTGSIIVLGILTFGYLQYKGYITDIKNFLKNKASSGDAISNYSEEVERAAVEFDLPYPYLMGLTRSEFLKATSILLKGCPMPGARPQG